MGDGLKLSKDKRNRSSSSLATLEAARSERKLEMNDAPGGTGKTFLVNLLLAKVRSDRKFALAVASSGIAATILEASIPEVDDYFAVAEARCNDLQDNIDTIKSLKRKKKLKKRSMTRLLEQSVPPDNMPFISVRTQPKKKMSPQAERLRRLEMPQNPSRGYVDPVMVEQHCMIGQVHGYNNACKQPQQERIKSNKLHSQHADQGKQYSKMRPTRLERTLAEEDTGIDLGAQIRNDNAAEGCDDLTNYSSYAESERPCQMQADSRHHIKASGRRKRTPRHVPAIDDNREGEANHMWQKPAPLAHWQAPTSKLQLSSSGSQAEERPVVELFNKNHVTSPSQRHKTGPLQAPRKTRQGRPSRFEDIVSHQMDKLMNLEQRQPKKETYHPHRIKYRSRRYEMPTVASQMKQAGMRYYYSSTNHTNIPFVVSKSTAPSHNIGVNIQQVLNGLKIRQPLSGIPLTMAHHMGLGYVAMSSKSAGLVSASDHCQINSIKVGQQLLRLPSYKYMSYNRLLSLYREGDGMVPRFLKAISRPHYFYTSMYNLATCHQDIDGATSKGRLASQEVKQNFAEFANLYNEYENINNCIKKAQCEPALEHRKEELSREIAAREQLIRKVVQDYRSSAPAEPLRASASMAEEGYRHSTFKLVGVTRH